MFRFLSNFFRSFRFWDLALFIAGGFLLISTFWYLKSAADQAAAMEKLPHFDRLPCSLPDQPNSTAEDDLYAPTTWLVNEIFFNKPVYANCSGTIVKIKSQAAGWWEPYKKNTLYFIECSQTSDQIQTVVEVQSYLSLNFYLPFLHLGQAPTGATVVKGQYLAASVE